MTPAARLRCAESHVAAIRRMVEEGAPVSAVLLQLRAVRGSLRAVAQLLLAEELRRTLREAGSLEAARLAEELDGLILHGGRPRRGRTASTPTSRREGGPT